MDMIIASHESINGHYDMLKQLFFDNCKLINKLEQIKYVNSYCSNQTKNVILGLLK